ncbi:MAG: hypothetical protein M9899_09140 [Bdellovibrionaceae bacterium]|nr:hypothetical protein [Pseudobdellovibrionaceae bacterium]
MDQRAWISCAFFSSGIEFIYWNMKWAGSSHPQNPAWVIVSRIHYFVLISVCVLVAGFLLLLFMSFLGPTKEKKDIEESATPIDSTVVERTKELEEETEKQKVEQQKLEEQRKQEVIKRRRERSANAAAHDALDDFL